MKKNIIKISFLLLASVFILWGCGNNENTQIDVEDVLEVEIDTTATTVFKFNNTLFSIPSPYQIAIMIKELDIDYNNELLNPTTNSGIYTDNFKKALNFGIYGADLGYLNIYEQTPDAINYFSVLKMMSQELGISGAFDKPTIK